MARKTSRSIQVEQRRTKVAELYCEGLHQWEISAQVGVCQQQISRDLKAVRSEWKESRVADFNEKVEEELAKIDHIEREAWEGWKRSCKDAERSQIEVTDGKKTVKKSKQGQAGDPRFLEVVGKQIERRCKLLGLDAPTKVEKNGSGLTTEQRRAELVAIVNRISESTRPSNN